MEKGKQPDGSQVFSKLADAIMKMPGLRIDRSEYLKRELAPIASPEVIERAIQTSPWDAGIKQEDLDKIANAALKYHVLVAAGISFFDGLPGGWWLVATVPADISQFYFNAVQLAQKLVYIYGWPDLNTYVETDDYRTVIGIFLGVMMGSAVAAGAISQLADALSKGIAERLPRIALTRYAFYNATKQVLRWVGVAVTKEGFADAVAKIVPVLGGVFSGGLTAFMMRQMGCRLIKYLKSNPFNPYEEASYQPA